MHYHVLGAGSIGSLFAHHLAARGHAVTLLLRDNNRLQEFQQHGSRIKLWSSNQSSPSVVPVLAEACNPTAGAPASAAPGGIIHNLLVATKAHVTAAALASVQHRLQPDSCVVLLQNGVLGVYHQMCQQLFPDVNHRPLFLLGSTTHGAYRQGAFSVTHAGQGQCVFGQPVDQEQRLGYVPLSPTTDSTGVSTSPAGSSDEDSSTTPGPHGSAPSQDGAVPPQHSTAGGHSPRHPLGQQQPSQSGGQLQQQRQRLREVLTSLAGLQELHADAGLTAEQLEQQLLVKLVVNCCANPLSALLRCRNGGLNDNPPVQQLQTQLVAECKAVFGDALPGSQQELLKHVQHVVSYNANNYNSMLQSVMNGHMTEVDYLNGYVVRQGEAAGLPCPVNQLMCQLVRGVELVAPHYRADAVAPQPDSR